MTSRDDGYIALATDVVDSDERRELALDEHHPTFHTPIVKEFLGGGSLTLLPDGKGYKYAYGPSGLPGLRHNYFALASAVFASIGGLLFGYDQGVIANVLVMKDFRSRWQASPWDIGLMTAMLELGALAGALLAGTFADRYSRRISIFFACVVFCVGSLLQCSAQSLGHLIWGRTIGGIGIGSLSMLSPLYMAEISPPEVRGSLMALEQLAIVLGVVFGFWTGFFTRHISGAASWRIPLAIQIFPGLLLAVGAFVLPPSPRLMIIQGDYDGALKVLARLRRRHVGDELLRIEFLEMQVEASLIQRSEESGVQHSEDHSMSAEWARWKRLFESKFIDRTFIGVLIMFFQQWSGINALLYYGPILMHQIGLGGDTIELIGSGAVGVVQFIAVVPAILFIDRLGRKPLLQWGGVVMGGSHLFIALLALFVQNDWQSHYIAAWSAVGSMYLFTAAYGVSYGPVAWILPSEVFPLSIRSKGAGISTASNWLNNFFIGLITPAFMSVSVVGTFLTFATACFAASLWSRYYVPETANVPLEEIDSLFKSDAGREDEELRHQIMKDVGLDALIRDLSLSVESNDDP